MRGGFSQAEQGRILPLFHDEQRWKQIVGFSKSAENDVYLLLANPDGTLRWLGHGRYSEASYAEVERNLP
jgi:hypothetical protein